MDIKLAINCLANRSNETAPAQCSEDTLAVGEPAMPFAQYLFVVFRIGGRDGRYKNSDNSQVSSLLKFSYILLYQLGKIFFAAIITLLQSKLSSK